MIDFSEIFSSKARVKILQILFYQQRPLFLRHIAYLSKMPVFSIQRALIQLVEEKIITRKRKKNTTEFSLNKNHDLYHLLIQLFDLEMKSKIAFQSNQYDRRAKSTLDFVSSALKLFRVVEK